MSTLPPSPPGGQAQRLGNASAGPPVDRLAYVALVTGILSIVVSPILLGSGILLGPGAAIMGYIARRRVAASHGTLGGSGVALAGLILGIIGVGAGVAILVFAFLVSYLFQCGGAGPHQPGLRC